MLILVYGLPGTGKTYFSERLALETGGYHLNTDIIRAEKGLRGRYDEKSKQEVYNILYESIVKYLGTGSPVIVDGTFHRKERREKIAGIASGNSCKSLFIEMRASESTIRYRLSKTRELSEAGLDAYMKIKKEFDDKPPPSLVLWSDDSGSLERNVIRVKNQIHGYSPGTCIDE